MRWKKCHSSGDRSYQNSFLNTSSGITKNSLQNITHHYLFRVSYLFKPHFLLLLPWGHIFFFFPKTKAKLDQASRMLINRFLGKSGSRNAQYLPKQRKAEESSLESWCAFTGSIWCPVVPWWGTMVVQRMEGSVRGQWLQNKHLAELYNRKHILEQHITSCSSVLLLVQYSGSHRLWLWILSSSCHAVMI